MKTMKQWVVLLVLNLAVVQAMAVEFGVFGDINFTRETQTEDEGSFVLGGLDLFASQDIGKKTKAFMEFVFEDVGDGEGFIIDLERLWIRYSFANALKLSAGRFHTPIGYWNKNYHHGTINQDTATRPFFLEFEDGEAGILPVHSVGIKVAGEFPGGQGVLHYNILFTNGASLDTADREIIVNNVVDPGDRKTITLDLGYANTPLGLEFSLFMINSIFTDAADTAIPATALYDQNIIGFDLHYNHKMFYILTELFSLENEDELTGIHYDSTAWYTQLGIHFTSQFSFIYRAAELDMEAGDTFYQDLGVNAQKYEHVDVIAFRYNIDESNALKLEYNQNEINENVTLQWSFLLF